MHFIIVAVMIITQFFPGTVYLPSEPVLLQSLGNPFLFRCADGWVIDGHSHKLSGWIYKYVRINYACNWLNILIVFFSWNI